MIMAAAGAGLVATIIAAWAQVWDGFGKSVTLSILHTRFFFFWLQVRLRADSVNANEVGNGLLAALVAITAGCPFVGYWGACLIGGMGVSGVQSGSILGLGCGLMEV